MAMTQLNHWIDAVREADSPDELIRSTSQLASSGHPDAAPCLMEVLSYNNPVAAALAVDGLVRIGTPAVDLILKGMDPRNYGARAWAMQVLARLHDVRGLALLERALSNDIGPSVRRGAARGLGELVLDQDPTARALQLERCLQALIRATGDEEWIVRYAVVFALEQRAKPLNQGSAEFERVSTALQQRAEPGESVDVVRRRARLALQRLQAA
ncbi:HEAT repeat domain-containing protein [Synechococcus sp. BMK-MC-1]|uniref:HEAT repeat domain-containing protein n=1 Tax=Synechococcus sp. BMK-MC-1 TaxID=1442551 RepID=UPI001644F206|nr:HEAT repeat domain-containing protein [Synechococcus sp. BMK-MC-1]QNI66701.1 phycocyanobilin:Cys-84 alpha-C-phycocyanin lyase/ CpcF subunit [Synechococcus sp. BMK-MC-1]